MSTQTENTSNAASNEPSPKKGATGWVIFAFFVIGFGFSLLGGWVGFPKMLYQEVPHPIDFNHALHMNLVYDGCNSCHYFREDGSFSGSPTLNECRDCHGFVMGINENEEKFVEEYVLQDKEVPWNIYSKQPECVYFSHAPHVKAAEMDCATCHGDIGESESLRPYEENRLTGYSRDIWGWEISRLGEPKYAPRMKMMDCVDCHVEKTDSKGSCLQCHK